MPVNLYRLSVSKGALLVLCYLWRYTGRDQFVWPGRETIAHDLEIESDRTLRRNLNELRKSGAIEPACEVRNGDVRHGWWLIAEPGVVVGEAVQAAGASFVEREVRADSRSSSANEARVDNRASSANEARVENDAPSDGRGPAEFDAPLPEQNAEGATVIQLRRPASEAVTECDRPRDPARPADENGRIAANGAGQKWPDKNVRTKMAARADKNGRTTSIEPPINQPLSVPSRSTTATSRRATGHADDDRVREGLTLLREWRLRGGDPDGLGRWPTPTPPEGVPLPRLALSDKLRDRLAEDRTPAELHRAVHLLAALVEAGVLPPNKWRAAYVFSGWLDDLVVQALEHQAKTERAERQREARSRQQVAAAEDEAAFSVDAMAEALTRSSALASLGMRLEAGPLPARHTVSRRPSQRTRSAHDHWRARRESGSLGRWQSTGRSRSAPRSSPGTVTAG
ncbi:MAG: helix-turn-helix domain-containing protein [Deltaproteobacteria bacterium]|nr:helix-turn-helix domain-containing protein [Deltaproteobacteria bacterium]